MTITAGITSTAGATAASATITAVEPDDGIRGRHTTINAV